MLDDVQNTAVVEFAEILKEHRRSCEKQGKYLEAEMAKNRLDELKVHEDSRRRENMRSNQTEERLGIEKAHMLEFQQFTMVWDRKLNEYEMNAHKLVEVMKDRHIVELLSYHKKLLEYQPRPKYSADSLNLRKIQDTLAKQKEYSGAQKMKIKAEALESWELEKWLSHRQDDLVVKEGKFKQSQALEVVALLKRIQTGKEEQKKQRLLHLERLLQRYQNVKAELEAQQNLERIRLEKQTRL